MQRVIDDYRVARIADVVLHVAIGILDRDRAQRHPRWLHTLNSIGHGVGNGLAHFGPIVLIHAVLAKACTPRTDEIRGLMHVRRANRQ